MNNKIIITLEDGKNAEYDIVLLISNNEKRKNYVFFTDNNIDTDGKKIIYSSLYNIENNQIILIEPKEEDFKEIQEYYEIFNDENAYKKYDNLSFEKQNI